MGSWHNLYGWCCFFYFSREYLSHSRLKSGKILFSSPCSGIQGRTVSGNVPCWNVFVACKHIVVVPSRNWWSCFLFPEEENFSTHSEREKLSKRVIIIAEAVEVPERKTPRQNVAIQVRLMKFSSHCFQCIRWNLRIFRLPGREQSGTAYKWPSPHFDCINFCAFLDVSCHSEHFTDVCIVCVYLFFFFAMDAHVCLWTAHTTKCHQASILLLSCIIGLYFPLIGHHAKQGRQKQSSKRFPSNCSASENRRSGEALNFNPASQMLLKISCKKHRVSKHWPLRWLSDLFYSFQGCVCSRSENGDSSDERSSTSHQPISSQHQPDTGTAFVFHGGHGAGTHDCFHAICHVRAWGEACATKFRSERPVWNNWAKENSVSTESGSGCQSELVGPIITEPFFTPEPNVYKHAANDAEFVSDESATGHDETKAWAATAFSAHPWQVRHPWARQQRKHSQRTFAFCLQPNRIAAWFQQVSSASARSPPVTVIGCTVCRPHSKFCSTGDAQYSDVPEPVPRPDAGSTGADHFTLSRPHGDRRGDAVRGSWTREPFSFDLHTAWCRSVWFTSEKNWICQTAVLETNFCHTPVISFREWTCRKITFGRWNGGKIAWPCIAEHQGVLVFESEQPVRYRCGQTPIPERNCFAARCCSFDNFLTAVYLCKASRNLR